MKNLEELLSAIGITIPEDKKTEFQKEFNQNYKTIAEFTKQGEKADALTAQLETATDGLKAFEGVNVEELKNKIAELSRNLQEKDTEYQAKLAAMEFTSALDAAITASGAKNAKAVKALLDLETLEKSQNCDSDIQAALEGVKRENDYLFTAPKTGAQKPADASASISTGCFNTGGSHIFGGKDTATMSDADYYAGLYANKK